MIPRLHSGFIILLLAVLLFPWSDRNGALCLEKRKIIAYIGFPRNTQYWDMLSFGVEERAEELNLSLVNMTCSRSNPVGQVLALMHAVKRGVDGIILGPERTDLFDFVLDEAFKRKIPVVIADTPIEHRAVKCIIKTDDSAAAGLAGDYIVEKTGGRGTLLILGGTEKHPNSEKRRIAVASRASSAGMNVKSYHADWKLGKAYTITKRELKFDDTIRAVFACNDTMVLGAAGAVKNLGLRTRVTIVGFDGGRLALEALLRGDIDGEIAQQAKVIGRDSVTSLDRLIRGLKVGMYRYKIGEIVTAENVIKFMRD